jgi:O-antigen ligase
MSPWVLDTAAAPVVLDTAAAPLVVLGLLAAAPLVLVAFVKALRNPMWLLALYAAVVPFGSTLRLPGAGPFGSLSTLLGLAAVAAFAGHLALRPAGRISPGTTPALAVLLVGVAAATVMWSVDVERTLEQTAVLASLVALYVLVSVTPVSHDDVRRFGTGVVAGGSIVGLYAIYLGVTGALGSAEDQRFVAAVGGSEAGEVADPNITAAALLLPLAVALDRAMRPGRLGRRLGYLVVAVALVAGVFLTGSRGGTIGALAVLLVLLARSRRTGGMPLALLVPVAAVVIAVAIAPQYVVERLTADTRSSGRTDIWAAGLRACPEHCATGSGWGTFASAHQQVLLEHPEARAERPLVEAHNLWLGTVVEGGLAALALLVLILWAFARDLRRLDLVRRAPPLAAFAGLVVTSVFLQTLGFKFFWLVLIYGVLTLNASVASPAETRVLQPVAVAPPRRERT